VRLWVVVPAYNEAAGITATLTALAAQTYAPEGLIMVDNASTDGTGEVVRAFAAEHPALGIEVVEEPEKGTGSAADTGFRHAIAQGATHLARTDADCLPPPGWTEAIVAAFGDGLDMVAGGIKARTDEFPLRLGERLLPLGQKLTALFGRVRPSNRGPQFKGPYVMAPACSLAITATLYVRAGGFPRAPIEEIHDDRELVNRVRRVTAAYGRRRDVWVYWSMRRARAYGVLGTLRWYRNHGNRPKVVDIRLGAS
jgi:glycosyltransferase involved in cell wall biosynthesis